MDLLELVDEQDHLGISRAECLLDGSRDRLLGETERPIQVGVLASRDRRERTGEGGERIAARSHRGDEPAFGPVDVAPTEGRKEARADDGRLAHA